MDGMGLVGPSTLVGTVTPWFSVGCCRFNGFNGVRVTVGGEVFIFYFFGAFGGFAFFFEALKKNIVKIVELMQRFSMIGELDIVLAEVGLFLW